MSTIVRDILFCIQDNVKRRDKEKYNNEKNKKDRDYNNNSIKNFKAKEEEILKHLAKM
jgi:hypothetical protein